MRFLQKRAMPLSAGKITDLSEIRLNQRMLPALILITALHGYSCGGTVPPIRADHAGGGDNSLTLMAFLARSVFLDQRRMNIPDREGRAGGKQKNA